MATIGQTTATQPESSLWGQSQATASQDLGKEEFLKLLVTQLANQDPLNPMNGQEFAAQLAQFSTVEQLVNLNQGMESQGLAQELLSQSINSGVAAGLIGKEVEAQHDTIYRSGADSVPLRFELATAASNTEIEIRNAAGDLVRRINVTGLQEGLHTEVTWDGKDSDGNEAPEGTYTLSVRATDAAGDEVASTTLSRGIVDRVTFGKEGILLWFGALSVPMSTVRSVEGGAVS